MFARFNVVNPARVCGCNRYVTSPSAEMLGASSRDKVVSGGIGKLVELSLKISSSRRGRFANLNWRRFDNEDRT